MQLLSEFTESICNKDSPLQTQVMFGTQNLPNFQVYFLTKVDFLSVKVIEIMYNPIFSYPNYIHLS